MVIWGQKLQKTNTLPGEVLRVSGGFGEAEVAREPRSAGTQKRPLNCEPFLLPGMTRRSSLLPIYIPLWHLPVAAELTWGFVQLRDASCSLQSPAHICTWMSGSSIVSQLRERRLPLFGWHKVWILMELTGIDFSVSSAGHTSPFGNIEEKVEGKRKGLLCTYTVHDTHRI